MPRGIQAISAGLFGLGFGSALLPLVAERTKGAEWWMTAAVALAGYLLALGACITLDSATFRHLGIGHRIAEGVLMTPVFAGGLALLVMAHWPFRWLPVFTTSTVTHEEIAEHFEALIERRMQP